MTAHKRPAGEPESRPARSKDDLFDIELRLHYEGKPPGTRIKVDDRTRRFLLHPGSATGPGPIAKEITAKERAGDGEQ